jgi:hypothetical protein
MDIGIYTKIGIIYDLLAINLYSSYQTVIVVVFRWIRRWSSQELFKRNLCLTKSLYLYLLFTTVTVSYYYYDSFILLSKSQITKNQVNGSSNKAKFSDTIAVRRPEGIRHPARCSADARAPAGFWADARARAKGHASAYRYAPEKDRHQDSRSTDP